MNLSDNFNFMRKVKFELFHIEILLIKIMI